MKNLLHMERYQLLRSRIYWSANIGIFLLGLLTAGTYEEEILGNAGRAPEDLLDFFNGMIYDSTFVLILICAILAFVLGQEFSCRTVSQEVCAGHKRFYIFTGKVIAYLLAFNITVLIYPVAGCIREAVRMGIPDVGLFLIGVSKAVVYSFFFNSAILLIPVCCCFCWKNTSKAVTVSAAGTFILSLYLGYGLMLGFPVSFLPIYQVREAVSRPGLVKPAGLAVGIVWIAVLLWLSWKTFSKSDLK